MLRCYHRHEIRLEHRQYRSSQAQYPHRLTNWLVLTIHHLSLLVLGFREPLEAWRTIYSQAPQHHPSDQGFVTDISRMNRFNCAGDQCPDFGRSWWQHSCIRHQQLITQFQHDWLHLQFAQVTHRCETERHFEKLCTVPLGNAFCALAGTGSDPLKAQPHQR